MELKIIVRTGVFMLGPAIPKWSYAKLVNYLFLQANGSPSAILCVQKEEGARQVGRQ